MNAIVPHSTEHNCIVIMITLFTLQQWHTGSGTGRWDGERVFILIFVLIVYRLDAFEIEIWIDYSHDGGQHLILNEIEMHDIFVFSSLDWLPQ